jgi:hypothetical protein
MTEPVSFGLDYSSPPQPMQLSIDCQGLLQAYAPAAGRLAAAMAAISARRRPIREGAERSNEVTCRIARIPSAPTET